MSDTPEVIVYFRLRADKREGYGQHRMFRLSHVPRVGEQVIPAADEPAYTVESVQHHLHQNRVEVLAVAVS
jgi:hypothetical protein